MIITFLDKNIFDLIQYSINQFNTRELFIEVHLVYEFSYAFTFKDKLLFYKNMQSDNAGCSTLDDV